MIDGLVMHLRFFAVVLLLQSVVTAATTASMLVFLLKQENWHNFASLLPFFMVLFTSATHCTIAKSSVQRACPSNPDVNAAVTSYTIATAVVGALFVVLNLGDFDFNIHFTWPAPYPEMLFYVSLRSLIDVSWMCFFATRKT